MIIRCLYDQLVPIAELKAKFNPDNTNKHPQEQLERLAKILEYQGARYPAKVSNRSGLLTAGHGRILAAELAGWAVYPVNFQDYDSEDQELADLTADNAIASWAELDFSKVNEQLAKFDPEFNIDMLGIKNFVIEPAEKLELQEDDGGGAPPEEPKTKRGDVYQLGKHRLMCGDSTSLDDVEKLMNGEKADMIFTDPPYNVAFKGQNLSSTSVDGMKVLHHKGVNTKHDMIRNDSLEKEDFEQFITAVLLNLKTLQAKAWYFTFCDLTLDELLVPMRKNGFEWKSIIVWMKNQATLSGKDYKSRYEPIVYGCEANAFYGERYKQEDVWQFQRTLSNDLHPTMKPIPLIEYAIENSSKPGESVVDLFGGSGSTMIACEKTGRKNFSMELDPRYCDVIVNRWEQYTGQKAELVNG